MIIHLKEDVPQVPKRLVTGTNADLRKLPLKEAKEICRDYGVREEEVSSHDCCITIMVVIDCDSGQIVHILICRSIP